LSASRAWRRKRPRRKRKRRLRRRRMTIRRGTPLRLILWMSLPAASISTI
ncbi:DNA (cytosine-5-)-methyltransferase, partial [Dysosmobacter welbionis]